MLLRLALVAFGLGLFGAAHGTEAGDVKAPPADETHALRGLRGIWLDVTGEYRWDQPPSVGLEKPAQWLGEMLFGGSEMFDTAALEAGVKEMLEKGTTLSVTTAKDRGPPPEAVVLTVRIALKGKPGSKDPPMNVELNVSEPALLLRNPAVRLNVSTYKRRRSSPTGGTFLTLEEPVREVVEDFIKEWREQNP